MMEKLHCSNPPKADIARLLPVHIFINRCLPVWLFSTSPSTKHKGKVLQLHHLSQCGLNLINRLSHLMPKLCFRTIYVVADDLPRMSLDSSLSKYSIRNPRVPYMT
ncbi:hypothetical protein AAC387_Pa03g0080 [Persea americana]